MGKFTREVPETSSLATFGCRWGLAERGVCDRLCRMNKRLTKISKYLSFVLSHHPEAIGVRLDADGWLGTEELVTAANEAGKVFTIEQVHEVLAQSERKRFELSEDGQKIRAVQEDS